MGAPWAGSKTNRKQRMQSSFDGGVNNSNPSMAIADNQTVDEYGWDTDSVPAIHTRKGRSPFGASGGAQTNLLTNFGTTELVRAVGASLQHDGGTGTWTTIAGTFADTDWDATNFDVSGAPALILTNGTDNVKVWNGSALTDLSANAPKGKLITNDTVRVWIAVNDVLNFCGFQAPSDWTSNQNAGSVQYYTPNGGNITGLYNFFGDKYVWKKDSMAVVQGTNYFNFRLRDISNKIGCVSFKTIQEVQLKSGSALFWLGLYDVYMFQGGLPMPIGEPIRAILNSLNASQISRCWGGTDGIRYFLGLVTGQNTQPDTLCMYDPRYGVWRIRKISDNMRYSANLNGVWYGGDANGQTFQMQQGTSDNGTAISWMVTTKDFDEGAPELEKEYWEVHFQIYAPAGTTFTLQVSTDQGTTYTQVGDPITTSSIVQDVPVMIPLDTVPLTHWVRFRLSGTGEVKLFGIERYFRIHPLQY